MLKTTVKHFMQRRIYSLVVVLLCLILRSAATYRRKHTREVSTNANADQGAENDLFLRSPLLEHHNDAAKVLRSVHSSIFAPIAKFIFALCLNCQADPAGTNHAVEAIIQHGTFPGDHSTRQAVFLLHVGLELVFSGARFAHICAHVKETPIRVHLFCAIFSLIPFLLVSAAMPQYYDDTFTYSVLWCLYAIYEHFAWSLVDKDTR
jgi:hypothetical protein